MKKLGLIPYEEAVKQLSAAEKIGQSFMAAAFINDSEDELLKLQTQVEKGMIGGLCFFHSRASAATNFEGEKEEIPENQQSLQRLQELIRRFQEAAPFPLLISMDAEWGLAMRVENTTKYPFAITLGAMKDAQDLVRLVGRAIGKDCRDTGIHWNFAPVVDVNANPENPVIGYRSFGEDAALVSELAAAFAQGLKDSGCLGCLKHFPGHGDTDTDSHLALPRIQASEKTLMQRELAPYRALIVDAEAVMVGHLDVPALDDSGKPATFSSRIIRDLLRDTMGFNGLVVSDALNMKALPHRPAGETEALAYLAGNDILCFPRHIEEGISGILEKADSGRIEESFKRIWKTKEKLLSETLPTPMGIPSNLMERLARASLTLLRGNERTIADFRATAFKFEEFGREMGEFRKLIQAQDIPPHETVDRVLMTICPPSAKPKNQFGFSKETLVSISDLILSKDTVIYLFGNPYFLDLIPWSRARAVVIAYEDEIEFELNAAAHFTGSVAARGKLPVTLRTHGNS